MAKRCRIRVGADADGPAVRPYLLLSKSFKTLAKINSPKNLDFTKGNKGKEEMNKQMLSKHFVLFLTFCKKFRTFGTLV